MEANLMKALISVLIVPSGIAYSLCVLGLLAHAWRRSRRASFWLLASAGAVALIFSSGMVAAALIGPLEYEYPAVHDARSALGAKQIVILTGYAADDPDLPLTGRLNTSSAFRVLMALQLNRDLPNSTVIVSGGPETARVMGQSLVKLGLPLEQLVLETGSSNTADSSNNLRPLVDGPFFLVTSAGHMARAMAVMKRQGLEPIATPTDFQMPKDWRRAEWRPSPQSLYVSDLAVHEYIGRIWYRIRDEE